MANRAVLIETALLTRVKSLKIKEKKIRSRVLFVVEFCLFEAHNSFVMSTYKNYGGQKVMKRMTSKFPGYCRKCNQSFPAGTEIDWSPETKAIHVTCPEPIATAEPAWKPEPLVPGVYELADGRIYVVKATREDKSRLYAKRFVQLNGDYRTTEAGSRVDFEFQYEKGDWATKTGGIFDIKLSDRMSLERAKELITLYGRCINCNRHLKAAKSVEQGIGPVCVKSFGPVLNPVCETTDGREIRRAA